jgi:hypothetical protein
MPTLVEPGLRFGDLAALGVQQREGPRVPRHLLGMGDLAPR